MKCIIRGINCKAFKMFGAVFVLLSLSTVVVALETEPQCSRYDYDHKIITALVTMEVEQKELKKVMEKQSQLQLEQQATLHQLEQTLREKDETIRQQEETLRQQQEAMSQQEKATEKLRTSQEDIARTQDERIKGMTTSSGSTYVRWGRTTCPDNGTETVYSGYAGGSHYTHNGAAANLLCLPSDPIWGQYDDANNGHASIYGAEYQMSGSYGNKFFKKDVYNHDVPCAVCRSVRASAVMVPARNLCYPGWTLEYSGYLVAGYHGHAAGTEYVCLDDDPEFVSASTANNDERLLYMVEARCGSLKCPPYVEGRELTCTVCTQ